MAMLIRSVLVWSLSTALVKIMLALGIAFTTYQGLDFLLTQAFGYMNQYIGQLPESLAAILSRFGLFEALSIICSVMLSIATIKMLKSFVGIK